MKKTIKLCLIAFLAVSLVFVASCALNVTQKTADEINDAIKNGEAMSYDDVKKKLGDPTIEASVAASGNVTGVAVWIKGVSNEKYKEILQQAADGDEEALDKLNKNAISVTFLLGKATTAVFTEKYEAE